MTLNSRQLTSMLIATLVWLTMSSSAHADTLTSSRDAVMHATSGVTAADWSGGAATGVMSGGMTLGAATVTLRNASAQG